MKCFCKNNVKMEKIVTDPIYTKLIKVVSSITDVSQYNSSMAYLKLAQKVLYKKYPQDANKFLKFVYDSLEFNMARIRFAKLSKEQQRKWAQGLFDIACCF